MNNEGAKKLIAEIKKHIEYQKGNTKDSGYLTKFANNFRGDRASFIEGLKEKVSQDDRFEVTWMKFAAINEIDKITSEDNLGVYSEEGFRARYDTINSLAHMNKKTPKAVDSNSLKDFAKDARLELYKQIEAGLTEIEKKINKAEKKAAKNDFGVSSIVEDPKVSQKQELDQSFVLV